MSSSDFKFIFIICMLVCLCWPDALDSPGVELMGHGESFDVGFRN